MIENDNTVNMGGEKNRYHHGDLRAALIAEGLKLIGSGPAETLSLREIARNAGVSATAVYRHFPDKAALLSALCTEGHAMMAAAFEKAMAGKGDRMAAFISMGRAYVQFALAHPALFRLMMAQPGAGPAHAPQPCAEDRPEDGMTLLVRALDDLYGRDMPAGLREARRLKSWALVHGLAMLMLDGQVPAEPALIDAVIDAHAI
ncbi:TetR family transcriptional regulator [Hyphomonas polymorpha PS728]|uniref:TetR family transcriptional regulator n=1 Tax=Hyphomonas polymorpha PS728 TaxID=1280954 RepID=A0A062VDR1_9PROT|nr:TetR/AcrR family transcriptional regulator [Hyphomonas polymorpha]KCZ98442.1 TetR family transcriptional regulator [Hyphomonas polymorpha PS728]